jgi:hypothetical protein
MDARRFPFREGAAMSTESRTGAEPTPEIPVGRPASPPPAPADPYPNGPAAAGAEPAFVFPDLTRPEPPAQAPPKAKPAQAAVPVAKPAPGRPKVQTDPDDDDAPPEELLTPGSIKGWAWSLAFHALLLLILGFWFFSPRLSQVKTFTTGLSAGSPFGSEEGLDDAGGFDEAIEMPSGSLSLVDPAELTKLPPSQVSLEPSVVGALANSKTAGGGEGNGPGSTASGGGGGGFGLARFGSGGENIQGVDVKVGDPQFTLIWETRADLDLHVLEPGAPEAARNSDDFHIFWEHRNGRQGGELDVDDIDGYGPENVYWVQGKGPPGEYKWYVHYYGGLGGFATTTRWKVRIKHNNQVNVIQGKLSAIGERSRTYTLTVGPDGGVGVAAADLGARGTGSRPATSPGWKAFSSPEGGFTVSVPENPTGQRTTVKTPAGELPAFAYSVEGDDGSYAVSYADLAEEAVKDADTFKLLDETVANLVASAQGKPSHLRKIALGGSPGREVEYQMPGDRIAISRVYLVKRRLYQVTASGTREFASSPDADAFLKSFLFSPP